MSTLDADNLDMARSPALPLDGLTVVELGHHVAGPFCAKLLAMQGARVIKIERPGLGDPARRLGPFPCDVPDLVRSGLFLYLNGGKESVTLNLKSDTGRQLARNIIRHAGVVVENFRPRVLPTLGLGADTLRAEQPDLVVTSISSFGATGPYADYRGDELGSMAMGGMAHLLGGAQTPPLKLAGNAGQYLAGTFALAGTLGAVFGSRLGRGGRHVTVAISDAIAAALPQALVEYAYTGNVGGRRPRNAGLYRARDGHASMSYQQPQWPRLPAALGRPELLDDDRFATTEARLAHQAELAEIIGAWIAEREKAAVYHALQAAHFPGGARFSVTDLYESPQYAARGFFVEIEHPRAGTLRYPGAPWLIDGRTWRHARAPLLGEHTAAVLEEMCGVARSDLPVLAANGAI
ncbi:MAG: CaiB/BaiF CoA transferase family protein [Dehalococcoidia bacterium]